MAKMAGRKEGCNKVLISVPTHADLHHHCTLKAGQTVADKSSSCILARAVTTHVVRQTTLVDVWHTHTVSK